MRKAEFKKIVAEGVARARAFLIVKIETEGNPAPEIIINPAENITAKMAYYERAYNDDMELIAAKENGKSIRIVDAIMTNNFNDLGWFVY
jgi:predicted Fe-Mo cluster-binding NifX family protein